MKRKRWLAILLAVTMISAMLPMGIAAEETLELQGIAVEKKYSDNLVKKFHLQDASFSLNDSNMSRSAYAEVSIGANVDEKRSSSMVELVSGWTGSQYPLGYKYYRSKDSGGSDDAWYQWARWKMNADEVSLFKKLLNVAGNLQVGGRYEGHIDTESGTLKGRPYLGIELNNLTYSDGKEKATKTAYQEHKMSEDEEKDTLIQQTLNFFDVPQETNSIYMVMGGTKGKWLFWDEKNFAEVYYPQAFFRDVKAPTVEKVSIEGGISKDGYVNYANGDKVKVKLTFSEPIRVKDNDYNAAFRITAPGLSNFKAVEYNETSYDKAILIYEAEVIDSVLCRSFSNFVAEVKLVNDRVTDLAGNKMKDSPSAAKRDDIRMDGYLPRVNELKIVSVDVKDENGDFQNKKEMKTVIKPGDKINFQVGFNQKMRYESEDTPYFTLSVNGRLSAAKMTKAFCGDKSWSSGRLKNGEEFDRLEFSYTVPNNVANGDVITIPAKKTDGYWELTELKNDIPNAVGNLQLTTNRKSLVKRTEMVAQNNEDYIFSMVVDKQAPVLTLTDNKGNTPENVFTNAEDAAKVTKEKSNHFKLYVKSDENIPEKVKAELVYVSKEAPVSPKVIATQTTGAYTGNNLLEDMYLEFTVPTEEIDSVTHDIYVRTTAYDEMYNKSEQKFYLAMDTVKPVTTITNGEGKGALVETGDVRYWEYQFAVDEKASSENIRVYYKFSNDTQERYTDSSTNFTVKSKDLAPDAEDSGSITYYAVDGSGNIESPKVKNYYISSKRSVKPVDEAKVGAYLAPREVEFTGFEAPSQEAVGTVYDFLVYRINNGEYRTIKSEDGGNVSIPASELSNDCVISYKLLRNTEADLDVTENGEVFDIIYHCDDAPPEFHVDVYQDSAGNAVSARVAAPGNFTEHPKNIVSATLTLSDGETEISLSTEGYIKQGVFYANVDLTAIIADENNAFTSGHYTLKATVTDANGHVGEIDVLGEDGMDIIIDAPEMKEIRVVSAHDAIFDESVGAFAAGTDTKEEIAITEASVKALMESGQTYTMKADAYRMEAQLYMKFNGERYPKFKEKDVWYTVSEDSGYTWTEYEQADIKEETAQMVEVDGVSYAVYTVGCALPEPDQDGKKEYLVRFRCGANVHPSDIATVIIKRDTTAPVNRFIVDAVGSDETGWSEDVHYTKEHVRYAYIGVDGGFMGTEVSHEILKIVDKEGNEVPAEQYTDYVEIQQTGSELKYVIFKQRCHLYVRISDMWNNSIDADYECMYIDELLPEKRIYNENTDEYTYLAAANIGSVSFGVVEPGSLTMTEEATALYEQLKTEGIVEENFFGDRPAQIDGKIITTYRFRQRRLAERDYDIIGTTYHPDGTEIETFKIQSVASYAEPITMLSATNAVSNLGKTIRAVETMTFNVPVAQVTGEGVTLLRERGLEMAEGLYVGNLMFATELNAILDITTGGTVYVVDRLGRAMEIQVDVSGTEFVEYTGHSISYEEINEIGSIKREESFIYGDNSAVRIMISGGDDVAAVKPETGEQFMTGASSVADTSGSEYEGFYKDLVIEAPMGFADREGTVVAAKLKVKNKTNLEEYNDVILLRCDDKAPVLLDAAEMKRMDRYAPISVLYLFYDRYGIVLSVERNAEEGYVETTSAQGIAMVHYLTNGTPTIRAVDGNGNELLFDGIDIDGIVTSNSLVEGRDYKVVYLDVNQDPIGKDTFHQAVIVKIEPIEGGKEFTSTATNGIYTDSEEDIILEMVDENGQKVLHKCTPPVDRTPPSVFAVQDNSGDYVKTLKYTVSVSDKRAGVARVYAKGTGENGIDEELELVEQDSMYQYYTYQADRADKITIVAVDRAGNETETVLRSNSQIVGPLTLLTKQSIKGATNKNVIVTLYAEDGRRIYTHVPEGQGDSYLAQGDYMVSGNDIVFTKNGSLVVECTDEAGNVEMKIISISNIDKTAPAVTPVIFELKDENDAAREDAVGVRFQAEGQDDRSMEIYLLHVERSIRENSEIDVAKLKEMWNEYMKDPENFVMTEEFQEVYDKLYRLDIKDAQTYAEVTENGTHSFYLMDSAGNVVEVPVTVTTLDEIAPVVQNVAYSFSAAPKLQTAQTVSGAVDAPKTAVEISKNSTGYLTNKSVDVTVTANEPVRFYGNGETAYATSITKTFMKNGIYTFAIEDKAGNVTEQAINVSNIEKRELFIEFAQNEIVVFKGKESSFKKSDLETYTVYTYDAQGNKKELLAEEYQSEIDYGTLNVDNISANTFDRNNPYTVTYQAADEAGNLVTRTRRVVLADVTDVFVTVNGEIPNAASCVYVDKGEVTIDVANYDLHSVVKVASGQKNAAQMKFASGELQKNADGKYTFTADTEGWHTIGVRTLFQDIFVVWVYVG